MVHTELATTDPDLASALLGCATPDQLPAQILSRLSVARDPSGDAELEMLDVGRLEAATAGSRTFGERRLGVLPCPFHLALRTLVAADHGLDGIILVAESGRSSTERDVTDVTGLLSAPPCWPPPASLARSLPASSQPATRPARVPRSPPLARRPPRPVPDPSPTQESDCTKPTPK